MIIDRLGVLTKGSCRGRRPPDSQWNDPMHLDRFGPNFSPTWPIGANLGSSWVQDSAPVGSKIVQLELGQVRPLRAARAKLGPTRANFADSTRHAENLRSFNCYFQRVHARPCCPHWACLRPNFSARCPHTGPSCACQVAPCWTPCSWAQVRAKLELTGLSSAQVKLGPSGLLLGPT